MAEDIKAEISRDIKRIRGYMERRVAKYRRNFNRYTTNGNRRENVSDPYGGPLAYYYQPADGDLGSIPVLNIIATAIDTKVSKLSQTRVRPFFNPINGLYNVRKVCRQAQVSFDELFSLREIYSKGTESIRDAFIFEYGVMWVRDELRTVERIRPWEVFFDPAELQYGKLTRCFCDLWQYPLLYIKDRLAKNKTSQAYRLLQEDRFAKARVLYYYDLDRKIEYLLCMDEIIDSRQIDYDRPPFILVWDNPPIKGGMSTSTADRLYTIQEQIDILVQKISAAAELSPANTIFIQTGPTGNGIKASIVDNRVGNIFEYMPSAGEGMPVVSTPRPIDPMYLQLVDFYEKWGLKSEGISELSAQSKKPTGINSGVGLQTLENIESDRHNVILQNYIKFFMDIANAMIEIFPEDDNIMESLPGRGKGCKWAEIKKYRDQYSIQFSASSSLSKDPQVKMEQIEKLVSMGILKPDMIPTFLEMPDLEEAYSILTASYDACQRMIERAIEGEVIDIVPIVNLSQLFQEAMHTYLRLDANDEKPEILENLIKLINIVQAEQLRIEQETTPPPPPEPMPPPVDEFGNPLPPVPPQGIMPGPGPNIGV